MATLKNPKDKYFLLSVSGSDGSGMVPIYSSVQDLLEDPEVTDFLDDFEIVRTTRMEFIATSPTHDDQPFFIARRPGLNFLKNDPFLIKKQDLRLFDDPLPSDVIRQDPVKVSETPVEDNETIFDIVAASNGTYFPNKFSYDIVVDTYITSLPTVNDPNNSEFLKQTRQDVLVDAITVLLAQSERLDKVSDETTTLMSSACEILTERVRNSPNSAEKVLVRIPRQIIDGIDLPVEDQQKEIVLNPTHTLTTTHKALSDNLNTIIGTFEKFETDVEISQTLALAKEKKELKNLFNKVKSLYLSKVEDLENDNIILHFDENQNFKLIGILVVKADAFTPSTVVPSFNENFIDVPKLSASSENIFKRARSLLYLINSTDFADDINTELSEISSPMMLRFLRKYTYKFIESTDVPVLNAPPKAQIEAAKKSLKKNSGLKERQAVSAAVGNSTKAIIADQVRTVVKNFRDPHFSALILESDGKSCGMSIDAIFDEMLNKVGLPKIMAFAQFPNLVLPSIQTTIKKFDSIPDITIDFPDINKINDITKGASDQALTSLSAIVGATLGCLLTDIIQKIRDGVNKAGIKNEEIGDIPLRSLATEEDLTQLSKSLSNFSSLDYYDVIKILEIISINSQPSEAIQIFEGNGDLEVIEIIGREIVKSFPKLSPVLETVYEVEEFLMVIGKSVLDKLRTAYANSEEKKAKDLVYSSFCLEEQGRVFDYISGRFPEEISRDQILQDQKNREQFLGFLNDLEGAISEDLKGFLFDEQADELLNFDSNDPTNEFLGGSVIDSYYKPVSKLFNIEASDMQPYFLYPSASQDKSTPLVSYQYQGEEQDGNSKSTNFRIKFETKDEMRSLQRTLAERNNFYWDTNSLIPENSSSYYFNLPPVTLISSDEVELVKQPYINLTFNKSAIVKDLSDAPTNAAGKAMQEGKINKENESELIIGTTYFDGNKDVFTKTRSIPIKGTLMEPYFDDQGVENVDVRGSAYGNYLKKVLTNYDQLSTEHDNYDEFIKLIKRVIYPLTNQSIMRAFAREASISPLFSKTNISKLNFSSGDPIENFMPLDEIKENVKKKKKYFDFLRNRDNKDYFGRKPIENAILLEAVDMTFRVYALENLISGMYVYEEISLKSLKDNGNIFEISKNFMLEELKTLGPLYEFKFADIIQEYYDIRSKLPPKNNIMKPIPSSFEFYEGTQIDAIICFLLQEQLEEVHDRFQASLNKVLKKEQKLEAKEFLDIIPYMDVPRGWSSEGNIFDDLRGEKYKSKLENTIKDGGFVLERYIRNNFKPIHNNVASQEVADLVLRDSRYFTIPSKTNYTKFSVPDAFNSGDFDKYKFMWEISQTPITNKKAYQLYGNLDGVVKQQSFEQMQKKIKKINKEDGIASEGYLYEFYKGELEKIINSGEQELSTKLQSEVKEARDNLYVTTGLLIKEFLELYKVVPNPFENENFSVFDVGVTDEFNNLNAKAHNRRFWTSKLGISKNGLEDGSAYKKYYPGDEIWKEWAGWVDDKAPELLSSKGSHSLNELFNEDGTDFVYGYENFLNKESKTYENAFPSEVASTAGEIANDILFDPDMNLTTDGIKERHKFLILDIAPFAVNSQEFFEMMDSDDEVLEYMFGNFDWGEKLDKVIELFNKRYDDSYFVKTVVTQFSIYLHAARYMLNVYNWKTKWTKWILDQQLIGQIVWKGGDTTYDNVKFLNDLKKKRDLIQGVVDYIDNSNILPLLDNFFEEKEKLNNILQKFKDTNLFLGTVDYDNISQFYKQRIDEIANAPNATAIGGPYTNFFDTMKYGLRLSYIFPGQTKNPTTAANIENTKDILDELIVQQGGILNFKEKAFVRNYTKTLTEKETDIVEGTGDIETIENNTVQNKSYYSLPLLEFEDEVSNYWEETPDIGYNIWKKYPQAFSKLKKAMEESDDYKMLMSEIFMVGETVNALGSLCNIHTKNKITTDNPYGLFSGTKINLRNIVDSLIEQRGGFDYFSEYTPPLDGVLENFSKLNNPAQDPLISPDYLKGVFGYSFTFAAKTALKILKGMVETTDPAIMTAKALQDNITAALRTAAFAAMTVENVSSQEISTEKLREIAKDIEEAAGSPAALAGLVLGLNPFPIGVNIGTPITPAGIAYLSQALVTQIVDEIDEDD